MQNAFYYPPPSSRNYPSGTVPKRRRAGPLRMPFLIIRGKRMARRAERFSQHGRDGALRILIAGDSSAVGTGASDPHETVAGYFGRDFPDATIVNLGRNGARMRDIMGQLRTLGGQRFDLAILQIGGNDLMRFTPMARLREELSRALTLAKGIARTVVHINGGNVGLSLIFPSSMGRILGNRAREARVMFLHAAKEHGTLYVDLYQEDDDDVILRDPAAYGCDLLHPSGQGYRVWYEGIRASLTPSIFTGRPLFSSDTAPRQEYYGHASIDTLK